jgi:sugar phosphate isomerase/epimerase
MEDDVAPTSLFFGSTIWTFNWNPPFEAPLKRLAKTGCKGFELTAWSVEMLGEYYTSTKIRELKALADGEGLTLTNFFYNLPFSYKAGAPCSTVDLNAYRRGVDVVAEIGSPIMTSMTPYPFESEIRPILQRPTSQEWTATVEPEWNWTAEYDAVVDGFARGCEIAAKAGIRVAVEPHPYRWVSSGQGMLRLIERTGAANLGLNFDPSHLFPAGDMPHYVVLALGDRIFNTHFSDNEGHTNAHWRPGRGKIDWKAIFAALRTIGYCGPITLELEDAPGASHWTHMREATPEFDDEMRRGINYLRDCAAELDISIS